MENLAWLVPAWILGAPVLVALYELSQIGSHRSRIGHSGATTDRSNVVGRQ